MNVSINKFDFLSSRLHLLEVTSDRLINFDLWHYLSVFESHVFGVHMQYNRIKEDLKFGKQEEFKNFSLHQAGLDIYYFTLTWDKLKKIFKKIKSLTNKIQQSPNTPPKQFILDYRLLRRRIDHLFSEFDDEIRNEYEHPSLKTYSVDNISMWGNIQSDSTGDIKAHAGKNSFTQIKKEHYERIMKLRVELFDLFIKHFSEKQLNQELIKLRDYIDANIDSITEELEELREKDDTQNFNDLLYRFTMYKKHLTKEGIQLSQISVEKFFSMIFPPHNKN